MKQRFGLDGPTTIEEFEEFVQQLLPSVIDWQKISVSYFYPGPQSPEYFTNKIATDSNIFRDKYHVGLFSRAIQAGRKVFAVVGSAHVVMQEPALRSMFGQN